MKSLLLTLVALTACLPIIHAEPEESSLPDDEHLPFLGEMKDEADDSRGGAKDHKKNEPEGDSRRVPIEDFLDKVVIQNVDFKGEPMEEAIHLVRIHTGKYCDKKGVVPVTFKDASSRKIMSFGSSAMTARILLNMIASEAGMRLVIDEKKRTVLFAKKRK